MQQSSVNCQYKWSQQHFIGKNTHVVLALLGNTDSRQHLLSWFSTAEGWLTWVDSRFYTAMVELGDT